jgi:hypothetical protein
MRVETSRVGDAFFKKVVDYRTNEMAGRNDYGPEEPPQFNLTSNI